MRRIGDVLVEGRFAGRDTKRFPEVERMPRILIVIALVATEGGILLSLAHPWPTSFFISAISFGVYLVSRIYDATGRASS